MRPSIFALATAFALVGADYCTTSLFGQGTCDSPSGVGGNGSPLTGEIVDALAYCFSAKYGFGPYDIPGLQAPQTDYSGTGNTMGIYATIGDAVYSLTIGNLCSCDQSMAYNIFFDMAKEADSGSYLTIMDRCGSGSACPEFASENGFLPSGMYVYAYSCPYNDCPGPDPDTWYRWEGC